MSAQEATTGALISNLGEDGGRLFNFSQIVVRHDHFCNTSSARKQQHKLLTDIKS